jgi:hypothetical protein
MPGSTASLSMFVYMTIETLIDTILVARPLQHNEISGRWLDPAHVCQGGTRRGLIPELRRAGNARIHASHVDERAPKPPLTDDPEFLADLTELDRGLIDPTAEAPSRPLSRLAPFHGQPAVRRLTPEASAALTAAAEALAAFDPAAYSSVSFAPAFGGAPPPAVFARNARDSGPLPEGDTSTSAASWRRRVLMAVLLIGLMLAGAATAGWIFRGPLQRVLVRWHVVR